MIRRFYLPLLAFFLFSACLGEQPINGTYSGEFDGQPGKTVRLLFHTTGDGLITASWKSNTLISSGLVTSERKFFGGRIFQLQVDDGPCKGVFDFHLVVDDAKAIGEVDPGGTCAEKKLSFTLPLTDKKAALKQPSI